MAGSFSIRFMSRFGLLCCIDLYSIEYFLDQLSIFKCKDFLLKIQVFCFFLNIGQFGMISLYSFLVIISYSYFFCGYMQLLYIQVFFFVFSIVIIFVLILL